MLSYWISQMGDCVNTDSDLGPFEGFACLVPLCLSSVSLCVWLCLDIVYIHHTNPPSSSSNFYFDLSPRFTSTNLSWHSFTLVFFLLMLLLFISLPLFPHLIFFNCAPHPITPFTIPVLPPLMFPPVFLVHVWCFTLFSPGVIPLDLLFFLFSFSCWDASS